jgi:hypothetical protein
VGVIAFKVRGFEVTAELRGDVQVLDLVAAGIAGDPDDPDFRLPVLVLAEDDVAAHIQIPHFMS